MRSNSAARGSAVICEASAPAQLTFIPLETGITDYLWTSVGGVPTQSSLVSPTVYLTAAHCLEFLPADAQIYVNFSPSAADLAGAIPATAFHFDPLYGHDSANPHDIGVVILPAKKIL